MAKLYFRYGTMDSAKTLNLLAVAHNYKKQGKRVLLIKPRLDVRFGQKEIVSRSGLSAEADILLEQDDRIDLARLEGINCLLVDEAQFLSPGLIDQLREITLDPGVPVICYGLRTDFQAKAFPGSLRLFEVADTFEEVKVTCQFCNKKAVFNLRLQGEQAVLDGPQIQLGGDERYVPVCPRHFRDRTRSG